MQQYGVIVTCMAGCGVSNNLCLGFVALPNNLKLASSAVVMHGVLQSIALLSLLTVPQIAELCFVFCFIL